MQKFIASESTPLILKGKSMVISEHASVSGNVVILWFVLKN